MSWQFQWKVWMYHRRLLKKRTDQDLIIKFDSSRDNDDDNDNNDDNDKSKNVNGKSQ